MTISQAITDFTTLAIQAGGWMELDRLYLQNRMMAMVGEETLIKVSPTKKPPEVETLLECLLTQAIKNQVIKEEEGAVSQLRGQLLDFLTPPPSVVNAFFAQHYAKKPEDATHYFYQLSKNSRMINTSALAEEQNFSVATAFGKIQFVIAPSEMEAGLAQFTAAEENKQAASYPRCPLCFENEGYKGRQDYPAVTNQRIIRMNLDGESWGFSYEPYGICREQALIFSEEHTSHRLSKHTFQQLLKLVDILPHYFVGAPADLVPLQANKCTHQCYQAGCGELPLAQAEIEEYFELKEYPLINVGMVKWPMSVIRLQGPNAAELVSAATKILDNWRHYSGKTTTSTKQETNEHSITSVARRKGLLYEMDLILRDTHAVNQLFSFIPGLTSKNIDLLNVMGVVMLPSAAKREIPELIKYVLQQPNELSPEYQVWADQKLDQLSLTKENAATQIYTEIGRLFIEALTATSAFEATATGKANLQQFIATL
jgi:UDPglucose--hexose-1-phosphate uridylyltransferase